MLSLKLNCVDERRQNINNMASDKFSSLREQLQQGKLLLPGDEGYDDSLKRWSNTCIKPAVGQPNVGKVEADTDPSDV